MSKPSVVLLLSLLLACGSSEAPDTTPRPDADVLTFDAAMLAPTRDSGVITRPDGGRDAGRVDGGLPELGELCGIGTTGSTLSGIPTNFPNIAIESDARFRIRSAGYSVRRDMDTRGPLLMVYLEVENVGFETYCTIIPDAYLDSVELIGSVETAPHFYTEFPSGVTNGCLAPGEVGIYDGIARGVDVADLERSDTLYFVFDSSLYVRETVRAGEPILSITPASTEEGWVMRGSLTPVRTIRNYGLRVFTRDSRGLIVAGLLDFPGSLENIFGGVRYDVETDATPCEIVDYEAYQSWIDDSISGLRAFASADPMHAAAREMRRRYRDLDEPR